MGLFLRFPTLFSSRVNSYHRVARLPHRRDLGAERPAGDHSVLSHLLEFTTQPLTKLLL